MANELRTIFIFDSERGDKQIDATRKNLISLNNDFNNLGKGLSVGKTISDDFRNASRAADSFQNKVKDTFKSYGDEAVKSARAEKAVEQAKRATLQTQAEEVKLERQQIGLKKDQLKLQQQIQSFKNKPDTALKTALADIKNYQQQTIKGEREVTRSIERETKLQTDARIRAGRRAANDAIRDLRSPSGGGGGGNFGSNFGPVLGALPGGSIAQGTVFGGAIGAGAAAVLETINLGKQLTSTLTDLSAQSVKVAADFQETTNSLAVFAGSTRTAKEELAAIDKVALNTPGLGLIDAEKGYQRLRALNFEAKISRDLIKGLGSQRVLSGADSAAVDRVVTNLIQLTSGTATAADVKQTIGQLPTLLPVFQKAFGTQDFGRINEIAKENPDEFIKKFSEELAKAQTAQAGLNVSLEKSRDVVLDLGRAFGEPFLDGLTGDVQNLTKFLQENRNEVQKWGQSFADALGGIRAGFDYFGNRPGGAKTLEIGARGLIASGTFGLSEAAFSTFNTLEEIGKRQRKLQEQKAPSESLNQSNFFLSDDFTIRAQTEAEKTAEANNKARRQKEEDQNKQKQLLDERQKLIEFQKKLDLSEIENNLKYRQAILSANSGNDPLRQIRENAALEQNSIRQQIAAQERFAKSSLSNLSPEDFKEGKGLLVAKENAEAIAKLNNDLAISQVNAQKLLAESGKKLVEDFRASLTSLSGQNNPLVKLMSDFETATERAEKQFGSFGKKVVDQIAAIERANLQKAINLQIFQNNFEALGLTQEAQKLRATPENQFAPFQRNLETVERKVDSLSKIFNLNRQIDEAGFYANQFNPNDPRSFAGSRGFDDSGLKIRSAVSDILGLKNLDIENTGIFGKEAVADKILDSIPSRDELLAKLRDPRSSSDAQFLLNQQVSALQIKREAERQKLNDFLENQKFLEFGRKFANEKIGQINNSNLTDAQKAEQRLAVANALGNDLDINLRRQKAEDLLSVAQNKQQETQDAKKIAEETRDAVQQIVKQLAEKGIKIEGGGVNITVKDETKSGISTSSPTASDTADQYNGNLNFGGNGGFSNR